MYTHKTNKISTEDNPYDDEPLEAPPRKNFLRKGQGVLGMTAKTPKAEQNAPRPASASAKSYSGMHSDRKSLQFKPSPKRASSPPRAGADSLNASLHDDYPGTSSRPRNDFSDFERHIQQVHSQFLGGNAPQPASGSGGNGSRGGGGGGYYDDDNENVQEHGHTNTSTGNGGGGGGAVDFTPVMQALEIKLARMTQENISLKSERESLVEGFRSELAELERRREYELAQAKREKDEELSKVKSSLRVMERRERSLLKHTEGRRERTEVEALNLTVQKLRQDMAARDSTWRMTVDKLKSQNSELLNKNRDAQEHLEELSEELRLASNGDWAEEKAMLQEQINALFERNQDLEKALADEREVNAALANLRATASAPVASSIGERRSVSASPSRAMASVVPGRERSLSPSKGAVAVANAMTATAGRGASMSPARSAISPGTTNYRPSVSPSVAASPSALAAASAAGAASARASLATSMGVAVSRGNNDDSVDRRQAWTEPRGRAAASSDANDVPVSSGRHAHSEVAPDLPRASRSAVISERTLQNGAVEQVREDGSKAILFKNGTSKEQTPQGKQIVRFSNGDVKEVSLDGIVTYFYNEARTTHITYPGGLQLIHFPNNQMEKHFPDGTKEIVFANKVRKRVHPNGQEEVFQ